MATHNNSLYLSEEETTMDPIDIERWRNRMDKECHDLGVRLLIGATIIIAIFSTLVMIA